MSGAGLLLAAGRPQPQHSRSNSRKSSAASFPVASPVAAECHGHRFGPSLLANNSYVRIPRFPTSLRRNLHLSPTTAEIIRPLFLIYLEVASPVGRSVVGPLGVLYEQPSPRGLISPRRFFFPAHKSSCARTSD